MFSSFMMFLGIPINFRACLRPDAHGGGLERLAWVCRSGWMTRTISRRSRTKRTSGPTRCRQGQCRLLAQLAEWTSAPGAHCHPAETTALSARWCTHHWRPECGMGSPCSMYLCGAGGVRQIGPPSFKRFERKIFSNYYQDPPYSYLKPKLSHWPRIPHKRWSYLCCMYTGDDGIR